MLHHGESDQHHDQHEAAEQRRPDDVIGHATHDGKASRNHPHDQQEPGRDQQDGAVVTVKREIDHQAEAEHRDAHQREPRDAGGDRRIDQRDRDQQHQEGEPADRDMRIANVPAVKIEVGEQEHQQRGSEDRLAGGAPDALGPRRHVEDLAPEAEIDADINEHRPAERSGSRKHHAALHDEQDSQEQRQEARDPDHDAVVERYAVDFVLVGVRLPQIDLRELAGAQLRHVSDDGAGIERDAEDVGGGAFDPLGPLAA
jgi:hypothetical protein